MASRQFASACSTARRSARRFHQVLPWSTKRLCSAALSAESTWRSIPWSSRYELDPLHPATHGRTQVRTAKTAKTAKGELVGFASVEMGQTNIKFWFGAFGGFGGSNEGIAASAVGGPGRREDPGVLVAA